MQEGNPTPEVPQPGESPAPLQAPPGEERPEVIDPKPPAVPQACEVPSAAESARMCEESDPTPPLSDVGFQRPASFGTDGGDVVEADEVQVPEFDPGAEADEVLALLAARSDAQAEREQGRPRASRSRKFLAQRLKALQRRVARTLESL